MSEKILFVDDEPAALQSYRRVLQGKFEVETALGGEEALASIRQRGPFAVVVSDIGMPGMDGVRFLARLRQAAPNTVRMVLTGQADLNTAIHAVNEGHVFQFLAKPCDTAVLIEALKVALAYHHERRERRIHAELPVRIHRRPEDEAELVHTHDISPSGARLIGIRRPLQPGDTLELEYEDRKAPFQVIWIGSSQTANELEAGVRCLTPDGKFWEPQITQLAGGEPLQRDIAVAQSVQRRLLPCDGARLKTLDYAGLCIQARTIGGDYYDFLDLGPGRVGLVLADVAGKGVAAALLMANLHGIVRSQCSSGCSELAQILTAVNRHFYDHTETHRYATLFLGWYDDATRCLRYVNCGHNPPLLVRRNAVEHLSPTATVLGLFENWECVVAESQLREGDILSIFTDGITETCGADGEEFGEKRVLEVLQKSSGADARSIVRNIERAVHDFRSGEQADDLTMVIACAR